MYQFETAALNNYFVHVMFHWEMQKDVVAFGILGNLKQAWKT